MLTPLRKLLRYTRATAIVGDLLKVRAQASRSLADEFQGHTIRDL